MLMNNPTSSGLTMPRSPCEASAACRKNDGVPNDARVAEIFRPTCPDFPKPTTTTRPLHLWMSFAAVTMSVFRRSDAERISPASVRMSSRADSKSSESVCFIWIGFSYEIFADVMNSKYLVYKFAHSAKRNHVRAVAECFFWIRVCLRKNSVNPDTCSCSR